MPSIDGAVRDMSPCKGCEKRVPGCHGHCDAFNEWRRKVDAANEARRKFRDRPLPREERRREVY